MGVGVGKKERAEQSEVSGGCAWPLGMSCAPPSLPPHHHFLPSTPQNHHLLASRAASPAAVETFVPSSPYAYAVQFAGEGVSDEAAAAAVTFEDLVAPVFLPCPPFVEDRTFPAAPGATEAVVALPVMNVFDAVDRSPTVQYPFASKTFSAIGQMQDERGWREERGRRGG